MELERELDDLNERLEEQGGATQAQVKKSGFTGVVCVVRGMKGKGEGFLFPPTSSLFFHFFFRSRYKLCAVFLPHPLPALLLAPFFARSLTLVPRSLLRNRKETLAMQVSVVSAACAEGT